MKKQTTSQFVIGVDLGDTKHTICFTDKQGMILKEFSFPNSRKHLLQLVADYPKALVALEVGTHSPWISRLLVEAGCEVIVANARKLRAIYQNERKCDKIDAQMLTKLVRVDPSLLHPVQHASEQCQRDSLNLKLRDILVRQRVHIISSVRGVLKSLGLIVPCPSTPTFPTKARTGGKAAKRKAVGAVARKLAVVMLTMWKKQAKYIALREESQNPPIAA
jgi:transposase